MESIFRQWIEEERAGQKKISHGSRMFSEKYPVE